MTTIINAVSGSGLTQTADGSGVVKLQSNGVTTNALAWVNFNGTTSPGTIRAQYNVSSVTRNGTGDYTVNFTNAMADANYAITALAGPQNTSNGNQTWIEQFPASSAPTTSACRLSVQSMGGAGSTYTSVDATYVSVVIFGN